MYCFILRRHLGIVVMLVAAASTHATNYSWNNSSGGFFGTATNWTPNPTVSDSPAQGDTATFGLNNTYAVQLVHHVVQNVDDLAGNVTLQDYFEFPTSGLDITGTLSLPNANGNSSLVVGGADLIPIGMTMNTLSVQNGGKLTVRSGSQISATSLGTGLNGDVVLDGAQFTIPTSAGIKSIGTLGGTGSLTLENGAIANFDGKGTVSAWCIAANPVNPTSGSGSVTVTGGSTLNTSDYFLLATDNINQTAVLNVNGPNSAFRQSDRLNEFGFYESKDLSVGSASLGTAQINISTTSSGGTLSGGSAGLNIFKTGSVIVGSSTTTGTLYSIGNLTIDGGLLRVFSGSLFNLASGKTLTIQNGGTADFKSFNVNGSSINFVAGSLSYAGNLLVGAGGPLGADLILHADRQLTLSGTTTVDAFHTLGVSGGGLHTGSLVSNNGYVDISSGTLATGAAMLSTAGVLEIDLLGTTRNSQYGALQASGAVSLAGTLLVTNNAFLPAVGSSFDILDWGTLTGTFSQVTLPSLPAGRAWDTSQLYTTGVISVVSTANLPGDYNGNGIVDAADYVAWRNNQGTTHVLPNDAIGGTIGAAQYNQWRAHFGQTAGGAGGPLPASSVPEPISATLFALGAVGSLMVARPR
jgi:hypothetical protein